MRRYSKLFCIFCLLAFASSPFFFLHACLLGYIGIHSRILALWLVTWLVGCSVSWSVGWWVNRLVYFGSWCASRLECSCSCSCLWEDGVEGGRLEMRFLFSWLSILVFVSFHFVLQEKAGCGVGFLHLWICASFVFFSCCSQHALLKERFGIYIYLLLLLHHDGDDMSSFISCVYLYVRVSRSPGSLIPDTTYRRKSSILDHDP